MHDKLTNYLKNKIRGLQRELPIAKVFLTTHFSATVKYVFMEADTEYKLLPLRKETTQTITHTLRRKSALIKENTVY